MCAGHHRQTRPDGSHRRKLGERLLVTAAAWLLTTGAAVADCDPGAVFIDTESGQKRFSVEVVDTPEGRNLGLMFRDSMPFSAGMLFVYDAPQPVSFWMRNTLIPLDMIFAGPDGRIEKVHANAVPLDETSIFGGDAIQYILEINGGLADRLGIAEGDVMRHPAIAASDGENPCP